MAYKTERVVCAGYGRLFETNRRAKYCGRQCYLESAFLRLLVACGHCGSDMHVCPSVIAKGGGKYCSMACKASAMSDAQLTGDYKECAVCGAEFYTKASRLDGSLYCSVACRGLDQRNGRHFTCNNCGKRFYLPASAIRQGKGACCSQECQLATYEGAGNPNWSGGIDPKQKRRSAELALPATLTNEQWEWLLDYYDHRCAYCGKTESECGTLAHEHVMPVSRGGGYTLENIVPACTPCNSTKHARTPSEAGLTFWRARHSVALAACG